MNEGGGLPIGAGGDTPVGEPIAQCPLTPTSLTVTVRRDFPRREGEVLGDWRWSQVDGTRIEQTGQPIHWTEPFEDIRPIFGWGIGRPELEEEGARGGGFTTDDSDPIAATVSLAEVVYDCEAGECRQTVIESTRTSGDDDDGECSIETTGLTGEYLVKIVPDACEQAWIWPTIPTSDKPRDIIYRSCDVRIRLDCGRMTDVYDPYDPPGGLTHARVGNRKKFKPEPYHLPVSLKPVWWKKPTGVEARRSNQVVDIQADSNGDSLVNGVEVSPSNQVVDMVVIHRTSGSRLGPALREFLLKERKNKDGKSKINQIGVHYVMDVDGHLIKLVTEVNRVGHAGGCWWEERQEINERSIGIEIVNPNSDGQEDNPDYATTGDPDYTYEQYQALISLLTQLTAHFPKIRHRIVGHGDIHTRINNNPPPCLRFRQGKYWDPGAHFEWKRLEQAGLGMIPTDPSPFDAATDYAGFFEIFPEVKLRLGDKDGVKYGGEDQQWYDEERQRKFPGNPIELIKQDIETIGYAIGTDSCDPHEFDECTEGAVSRFLCHFQGSDRVNRVDRETASRIKAVADVIPSVPESEDGTGSP